MACNVCSLIEAQCGCPNCAPPNRAAFCSGLPPGIQCGLCDTLFGHNKEINYDNEYYFIKNALHDPWFIGFITLLLFIIITVLILVIYKYKILRKENKKINHVLDDSSSESEPFTLTKI